MTEFLALVRDCDWIMTFAVWRYETWEQLH